MVIVSPPDVDDVPGQRNMDHARQDKLRITGTGGWRRTRLNRLHHLRGPAGSSLMMCCYDNGSEKAVPIGRQVDPGGSFHAQPHTSSEVAHGFSQRTYQARVS